MWWSIPAKATINEDLKHRSDRILRGVLLLLGVLILLIALWPGEHPYLRAATIAWVVLP